MSRIKLVQVKEIAYNIIVIMYWHLKLEKKRRVKKSREKRKKKERKGFARFVVVITERRSVFIRRTRRIRKTVVAVMPNHQMSVLLWQPLITKTNDYTSGKSLRLDIKWEVHKRT